MTIKTLIGLAAAGCLFSSVAFGQTLQITGTVSAFTDDQITLKSGPDIWTIKRDSTTTISVGTLTVGASVTVVCLSVDAHKNEIPAKGGG